MISQLSGAPGVRKIFFDLRIKCRGIAPPGFFDLEARYSDRFFLKN